MKAGNTIEDIFLKIEKINNIKVNNYNQVNNKWIVNFEFNGNKKELEDFMKDINDFKINNYLMKKQEENIYIEGLLEDK